MWKSTVILTILVLFAAPCFGLVSGTVTCTAGKTVSGATVTFTDESNPAHILSTVTDGNGKYQIEFSTSVKENVSVSPEPFSLGQNFPNPFNPTTVIPFVINKAGVVRIDIFSITGQRQRTLMHEYKNPGQYSVVWNTLDERGARVGSGVYLYRLQADRKSDTRKMLLLDGGAGAVSTAGGFSSLPVSGKIAKMSSITWRVKITCDSIKTYTDSLLVLTEGNTYDFTVILLPGITFVSIPGGTFEMGNMENAEEGNSDEKPVHTVTVSSFEMGRYEITNAQYAKYLNEALASGEVTADSVYVTGAKGAYSGEQYMFLLKKNENVRGIRCFIEFANGAFTVVKNSENYPVSYVTWNGSKAFAEHYGLDLPREAEWEYACRGGGQYKYGTDDGTLSINNALWGYIVPVTPLQVEVGSYPKNPFGLYDMSGSKGEWCADLYGNYSSESSVNPTGALSGSYYVFRGGCAQSRANECRSAWRGKTLGIDRNFDKGFRVVRRP
jgi:formylglycine-generating enzyme required for sulfatase activity